jgi:quercetin dioxygenase-like cupin family protein
MFDYPITDLAAFVPIPAGKRASHPLIDLAPDQTKVVMLALDEGVEVPPHAVDYEAGVLLLAGSIEVMLGETWHPLRPGQYLAVPRTVRHAVRALTPSHALVIHARGLTA